MKEWPTTRKRWGTTAAVIVAVMALCSPAAPLFAWGSLGHQMVNAAAIALMPEPLRAYFERHRAYLIDHASDPDLLARQARSEGPHHYTDMDVYGPYPFAELRRVFVEEKRWVSSSLERDGDSLWQIDRFATWIEKDFSRGNRGELDHDLVYMAHYAADLTQPLHTTRNYDGQDTGQRGVHGRFETELVDAMANRWRLRPAPAAVIPHLHERIFDVGLESYRQIPLLLSADRQASQGISFQDPQYMTRMERLAGPLAESRLEAAATFVSSLWYTAWVRAGKPDLRQWTRAGAEGTYSALPGY